MKILKIRSPPFTTKKFKFLFLRNFYIRSLFTCLFCHSVDNCVRIKPKNPLLCKIFYSSKIKASQENKDS